MPRPIRIEYEKAVYHVTARGNEKKEIFTDDGDRLKFLELLKKYVDRHGIILYCYVLMGNHYHLVVETPNSNLSAFMHDIQSHYTGYFNWKNNRVGHLFQGRYKAIIVEKNAYLIWLSRYVHLNPVRSGFTEHPEQWRWSSYSYYIKPSSENALINRTPILLQYGKNPTEACYRYKEYVESEMEDDFRNLVDDANSQIILGSEDFVQEVRRRIEKTKSPENTSGERTLFRWSRGRADEALEIVSRKYGVKAIELKKKKRRDNTPRDVAIWLFHRFSKWSMKEIGEEFGVGYGAISKAVIRISLNAEKDESLSETLAALNSQFMA